MVYRILLGPGEKLSCGRPEGRSCSRASHCDAHATPDKPALNGLSSVVEPPFPSSLTVSQWQLEPWAVSSEINIYSMTLTWQPGTGIWVIRVRVKLAVAPTEKKRPSMRLKPLGKVHANMALWSRTRKEREENPLTHVLPRPQAQACPTYWIWNHRDCHCLTLARSCSLAQG